MSDDQSPRSWDWMSYHEDRHGIPASPIFVLLKKAKTHEGSIRGRLVGLSGTFDNADGSTEPAYDVVVDGVNEALRRSEFDFEDPTDEKLFNYRHF
jgi:hypothetical protein